MSRILVTGARSGLGKAIYDALDADFHTVISYDILDGQDVCKPDSDLLLKQLRELDVLINCAGINFIDWIDLFTEEEWDAVMDTNAKGIFMMTKAVLPLLKESRGTIVNIVSNASHVPMTCSTAYNASKGAAHIMTLQMARELTKRYGITVFGIAPNKLKGTGMSLSIDAQVVKTRGWSPKQAELYQLQSLLTGEETPPQQVAEFLAYLLQEKDSHRFLTGTVIPYGA